MGLTGDVAIVRFGLAKGVFPFEMGRYLTGHSSQEQRKGSLAQSQLVALLEAAGQLLPLGAARTKEGAQFHLDSQYKLRNWAWGVDTHAAGQWTPWRQEAQGPAQARSVTGAH